MDRRAISPETLRSLLEYDPLTGLLAWKERDAKAMPVPSIRKTWNARFAGKPALNSISPIGYRIGAVLGVSASAHRVIWALVYGAWPDTVDHINGDRSDNRLANLRSVSRQENQRNMKLSANNKSGHVGVYRHSNGKTWCAQIKRGLKTEYLGSFPNLEDAVAARREAQEGHNYHVNHGRKVI